MISLFVNDPRYIGIFVTILVIIVLTTLLTIFRKKIPIVKKYYTQNRLNSLLFGIGCIIGLVISSLHGWTTFNENETGHLWIRNILYFMSGTNSFILTFLFLWFACMLPIRYFSNICVFTTYKEPLKKLIKLTLFYTLFASIAIGISTMQYGLTSPFFEFDSAFSNNRQDADFSTHPAYYVAGRYFLVYVLRNELYTVIFMAAIVTVCLIEFLVIKYMQKRNYGQLIKLVKKLDKIAEWAKFIQYTTPILLFFAVMLSLSIHSIATVMHLTLLFMMLIILTIVIFGVNSLYTWWTKTISYDEYKCLIKASIIESWKGNEIISSFDEIKSCRICKHLDLIGPEQNTYNIFATIIFSIVITSFLGFANGPLLKTNDPIQHLYFWLSLFFIGYLLMFAYTFKYTNIVSSKLMMATGTYDIIATFNTGILNFFNPIINKLATFSSIVTLYSIAFKHAKYDTVQKE